MNGFWSLLLALGLLYTAWQLHWARSWTLGPHWLRNFLADYGVVSMVRLPAPALWCCMSIPDHVSTPSLGACLPQQCSNCLNTLLACELLWPASCMFCIKP